MNVALDRSYEEAVRRIYGRYVREVVETYSFCPWAQKARETGKVTVHVSLERHMNLDWALEQVQRIAAQPCFEIGILILPRLQCSFSEFGRLVSSLRQAHGAQYPEGDVPLAMAPFHPHGAADVSTPGRVTSYVRRSPDPTIQLVRRSALAAVRKNERRGTDYIDLDNVNLESLLAEPVQEPMHQRVLEANMATLQRVGLESLESIYASIRSDRTRAYSRFEGELTRQ